MQNPFIQILLLVILLLAFLFTASKNYRESLQIYTAQVLSIFAIMLIMSWGSIGDDHLLLFSIVTGTLFRVIIVPNLIFHFLRRERFHLIERDFRVPVFGTLLIELAIFFFTYAISIRIFGRVDLVFFACLILIFFGFVTSFTHKRLFSNVLGLLMIENAIFLLSVFLLGGIPFSIELAIMFNVLFGFIISLIALTKIKSIDARMSIDSMQNLKESFHDRGKDIL